MPQPSHSDYSTPCIHTFDRTVLLPQPSCLYLQSASTHILCVQLAKSVVRHSPQAPAIDPPSRPTSRLGPGCHPKRMRASPRLQLRSSWRTRYAFAPISPNRLVLIRFLRTFGMKNVSSASPILPRHSPSTKTSLLLNRSSKRPTNMPAHSRKKVLRLRNKSNN